MYALIKTEDQPQADNSRRKVRTYRSTRTGKELTTYLLRQDAEHTWWTFTNLFDLPFIRTLAANHVVRLYGHGLQLGDVQGALTEIRALAKSTDTDKLDKIIAKTYELENLSSTLANPVKQCMGLCTLYVLLDDERPDVYDQAHQSVKMTLLSLDTDAQAFFLTWWTGIMEHSGKVLDTISRIASSLTPS